MNIALIGYRGSGKSSVGKRLAALLHHDFVDTDDLIIQSASKTIREIFAAEGEAGFRKRESAAIAAVGGHDDQVIALGGGAILNPANIAALKATYPCKIIWLHAPPEILYARIQSDAGTNATRPNLTAGGGLEEVQKLLAARTPLYQSNADITLDVTDLSLDDAADRLMGLCNL